MALKRSNGEVKVQQKTDYIIEPVEKPKREKRKKNWKAIFIYLSIILASIILSVGLIVGCYFIVKNR